MNPGKDLSDQWSYLAQLCQYLAAKSEGHRKALLEAVLSDRNQEEPCAEHQFCCSHCIWI